MSNTLNPTATIESSETTRSKWTSSDTTWMLSLYGTAIGAGVLFLPIKAGSGGLIPLLFVLFFSFPMAYLAHRGLCRFILAGSSNDGDITVTTEEFFGPTAGNVITFLYFLIIFPILLIYSVGLTNTTLSFMENQLHLISATAADSLALKSIVSLAIVSCLMLIINFGQEMTLKVMSYLVYPFICVLMFIAVWMSQYWSTAIFSTWSTEATVMGTLGNIWLIIPVMVFAFNHSPIISSLAVAKKKEDAGVAEQKCSRIIKYANILMVVTVMFFVVSCALALSPEQLSQAAEENLPILSYVANHFGTPFFSILAPIVAFVAMSKSFFGHYLGAKEGFDGLVTRGAKAMGKAPSVKTVNKITFVFIFITCWVIAILSPNVLDLIETLVGPIIASILFLLPMYAISRVPALAKYKGQVSNVFVTVLGLIAISAIVFSLVNMAIAG
ncbi:HAAAP family serine/threonine permease [Wohlfahrtiimonas larvae]|uniref:HAAAP family serine/threonine permease n=1 Tax=Wohlfahrtiimonas larvae TaxID=1157986 RepID=A0ABP9N0X0_9GAMM|nr:HAAAP family serine/threonine permease [Wohlfahrtiimonas larvae]